MDAQDKTLRTPLLEAIANSHGDVVRYLIQSGACVFSAVSVPPVSHPVPTKLLRDRCVNLTSEADSMCSLYYLCLSTGRPLMTPLISNSFLQVLNEHHQFI